MLRIQLHRPCVGPRQKRAQPSRLLTPLLVTTDSSVVILVILLQTLVPRCVSLPQATLFDSSSCSRIRKDCGLLLLVFSSASISLLACHSTIPDFLSTSHSAAFCAGTILAISAVEDGISDNPKLDAERRVQSKKDLRTIVAALKEIGTTWTTAHTSAAVLEGEWDGRRSAVCGGKRRR